MLQIIAGPLAVAAALGGVSPPAGFYPGDKIEVFRRFERQHWI